MTRKDRWKIQGEAVGLREATIELARRLSIYSDYQSTPFPDFDAEFLFGTVKELTKVSELLIMRGRGDQQLEVTVGDLRPGDILELLKVKISEVYTYALTEKSRNVLGSYADLLQAVRNSDSSDVQIDVFTTNYDPVAEQVFKLFAKGAVPAVGLKGARVADGFLDASGARPWAPETYERAQVRVHKLHGSVTWKWKVENSKRVLVDIGFSDPKPESDCLLYFGYKAVPNEPPFDFLHDRLADALRAPGLVVLVGSRMIDPYIRHLFETALRLNDELRMICVLRSDPSEGIERLRRAGGDHVMSQTHRGDGRAPAEGDSNGRSRMELSNCLEPHYPELSSFD